MKIYLDDNRKDVYLDAYYPGNIGDNVAPPSPGQRLPAVLICPGGGYRIIGTTEGRPVSDRFTDAGCAAFILHYTVGEGAEFGPEGFAGFAPALDLDAAMRLLHENAEGYGINPNEIVLAGFSAGGHLCAGWCFSGAFENKALLPKALILTYPMGGGPESGGEGRPQPYYDVTRMPFANGQEIKALPVFIWHAKDDMMVPFSVSERFSARLAAEGVPHTFLVYEHGIHARPFYDPDWFTKALAWLKGL